jgi:membrane protein DedA with SNARE-associated domain/rhodanese-related sulfurtransferase
MDILRLTQALQQDAVTIVFLNVLLKQMGLPVPAVPTLLLAGSLSLAPLHLGKLIVVAVLASVMADWIWYRAGKLFGYRLLAGLCKLSINPASCVSQTEGRFARWGLSSLVVAKFIPGFGTVAPPIAGALGMHQWGFLLAAGLGAALWAGVPLGAGWLLKDAVQTIILRADQHSGAGLLVVLLLAAIWVGWKLWQRYRFKLFSAIPHITANELIEASKGEKRPLVLDLRGAAMIGESGPIAGATVARIDDLRAAVGDWPKDRPIVTICNCPQDASAIQAAQFLLKDGFMSVRPLRGGYEAWVSATAPGATLKG